VLPRVLLTATCALALLAGCTPRTAPQVQLSEAETMLVAELTRDTFVRVEAMSRDDDGFVTLRTAQGRVTAWYRLMPSGQGSDVLVVRRIDDRQELRVAWSEDQVGTGPAPRGIRR
jgi:hypothetical protein